MSIDYGKIKSSIGHRLMSPPPRPKVSDLLMISGGGTSQTFFALGAVRCLIDNQRFNFDVISAVSGGTILLLFIELCILAKLDVEPGWYQKYVKEYIYDVAKRPLLERLVRNRLRLDRLSDELFALIPKLSIEYQSNASPVICEYCYLDADRKFVSCDHSDIIDTSNDVRVPLWYFIRLARCTLPFTQFYDRATIDAGSIQNIAMNSSLTRYDPENVYIICGQETMSYENVRTSTVTEIIASALGSIMGGANYEGMDLATVALACENVVFCGMSNNLDGSKDKYHKNLFSNYYKDTDQNLTFYNAVLFSDIEMCKVLENEGYIQMFHALQNPRGKSCDGACPSQKTSRSDRSSRHKPATPKLRFDIPNPEVYNDNVHAIYRAFRGRSVLEHALRGVFGLSQKPKTLKSA